MKFKAGAEEHCPICLHKAKTVEACTNKMSVAKCSIGHWWVYGAGVCQKCANNQNQNYRPPILSADPPLIKRKKPILKKIIPKTELELEYGVFIMDDDDLELSD